jgi:hypothetical protein
MLAGEPFEGEYLIHYWIPVEAHTGSSAIIKESHCTPSRFLVSWTGMYS